MSTDSSFPDPELERSVTEEAQEIVAKLESIRRLQGTLNSQEEAAECDPTLIRPLMNINVPATHFYSANKELLDSGDFADAKVFANGKTYNVHKSVLCTRSKFFRTGFASGFREGQASVIKISAPDNIDRLLEFLYTGAVDLRYETNILGAANELSVLGDFYLSDELKNYAIQVLGQYLGEHLISICDIDDVRELPAEYDEFPREIYPSNAEKAGATNFHIIKEAGFVNRLCDAIRDAYATPSGIHQVYVDFVFAARIRTFGEPQIQALKDEIPEFGVDLLAAMMTGLRTSVFEGNLAFEKWKDCLFRHSPVEYVSISLLPSDIYEFVFG